MSRPSPEPLWAASLSPEDPARPRPGPEGKQEGGPVWAVPPSDAAESCRPGLAGEETEAREVWGLVSSGFRGTAGERGGRVSSPACDVGEREAQAAVQSCSLGVR